LESAKKTQFEGKNYGRSSSWLLLLVLNYDTNVCLEHDLANELDAVKNRMLNLPEINMKLN